MTNQGRRRAGGDRGGRAAGRQSSSRTKAGAAASTGGRSGRRYAAGSQGPNGAKRRKRGWRKFVSLKAFGLYFLGMVLAVVAGIGIAYAMTDIPEANDFARSESTIVYWNDGKTELGRFSAENRESVDISAIPQTCQDAVVAAEDRSFYENSGFDPVGIMRAGVGYIRNSGSTAAGGGSTITQQYVKNYYLTHDQTATRKVKELFIAVKIDRQLDKDDILASYLNTIWFGRGLYGIQTASKSYFGKPVSELNLSECVGLASILRSPHRYDPTLGAENEQRFAERVRYVVDGMVSIDALDEAEANKVKPPPVQPEKSTNRYGGPNGYLLKMVRDELLDNGFTENDLDTGGLRIVTTFDRKAQRAALQAIKNERPTENAEDVRVALAAVEPGDGAVRALYGGPDYVKQQFNDAVDGAVQGGSNVKPFALVAALEEGISLESRFSGDTLDDPSLGPPVHNQNDKDYGEPVDLIRATESSINTAYVDLTMTIGADKVVDAMEAAGLPMPPPESDGDNLRDNPRVSIGIAPTPAVEMAEAYATLAAGGRHADWYTVKSVTEPGGNVRYEMDQSPQAVFDPSVVADTTYALTRVVENGSGEAAQALGRPSAGKTGTHEDLTAWYSGYTPQLATSVVYFRGDGEKGGTVSLDGVGGMSTFSGGGYPARTWTAFMAGALEGTDVLEFPEPAEVGEAVNPSPTSTPTPTDEPTEPDDGDESGGDESGGDDSGGDDSGGDESGGDDSGSDESGGDDSGGDDSGSDESGGDDSGGDDSGGDETGDQWGEGGGDGGTDRGNDRGNENGSESGRDDGDDDGGDGGGAWGGAAGTETG